MEGLVSASDALRSFSGRRIFVTGHTGFKGSWLSLWLKRLGAEVTGFSDAIPTSPSHYEAVALDIDDRRGDICDPASIDSAIAAARPDIVFHFAAQSLVRKAYADPLATYRANVTGTLALLQAARRNGVASVIVATTDKVYRNDESGRRYREGDELGGSDPYSASKSCAELATRSFAESFVPEGSMKIATVRAGNVVGGGDWSEDRLVPDLMRAAFGGRPGIVRNPQSTRPWQHVLDVLAGYLQIGAHLLSGAHDGFDSWNLGPQSEATIRVQDLLDEARAQIPRLAIELQPDTSGRPESGLLQLDSTKAMTRLGWRPKWEVQLIERTVDWYRAYYEQGRVISGDQIGAYEAALD